MSKASSMAIAVVKVALVTSGLVCACHHVAHKCDIMEENQFCELVESGDWDAVRNVLDDYLDEVSEYPRCLEEDYTDSISDTKDIESLKTWMQTKVCVEENETQIWETLPLLNQSWTFCVVFLKGEERIGYFFSLAEDESFNSFRISFFEELDHPDDCEGGWSGP